MRSLDIALFPRFYHPIIEIDGAEVKAKKGEGGSLFIHYETEKPSVSLHIYTLPSEFAEPHWFGYAVLFFFLSIFSVFDKSYSKKDDYRYEYQGSIALANTTTLSLSLSDAKEGGPALLFKGGSAYSEAKNLVSYDPKGKAKRGWLIAIRVIMTAALAVLVGYGLVVSVAGAA